MDEKHNCETLKPGTLYGNLSNSDASLSVSKRLLSTVTASGIIEQLDWALNTPSVSINYFHTPHLFFCSIHMPTTDESSGSDLGTYGYTVSDTNTAFRHEYSSNSLSSLVRSRKLRRFGL